MFSFSYPAAFRPDEDGRRVVSFPDFPQAHTDGKDKVEAMQEAIDCLGSVLAELIATRQAIPAPSPAKRGQRLVPVPFWVAGNWPCICPCGRRVSITANWAGGSG